MDGGGGPQARDTATSGTGRAAGGGWGDGQGQTERPRPHTLLQSRRPSRQRQLLQSSTQELPCGKGTPCDQQDLPNTITAG